MPITVTISDGTETVTKTITNAAALRIKKGLDHSVPIDTENNPSETNLEQFMRFIVDRIKRSVVVIERAEANRTVNTEDLLP